MDLLELLRTRKSVRKYSDKEISCVDTRKIVESAFLGPSGHNARPLEVIVVEDKEILKSLSKARVGAANMLSSASRAIVAIADEDKSTTCIEDSSVAMTNMHLAAHSLGIGSCWIQIRGREAEGGVSSEVYVKNLLNIPENYLVEAILSLGYEVEETPVKKANIVLHKNNFKGKC